MLAVKRKIKQLEFNGQWNTYYINAKLKWSGVICFTLDLSPCVSICIREIIVLFKSDVDIWEKNVNVVVHFFGGDSRGSILSFVAYCKVSV
jgi:hypothetical protein